MKHCPKCQHDLPLSEFWKASKQRDGLQPYCKACCHRINKEWKAKNPKKLLAIRQRAYWKDPEKQRMKRRNLPVEERKAKNERQRAYRLANPDKIRMLNKLRFHKQRAAGDMPERWRFGQMFCRQDARCVYCDVLLSGPYHIDHKTPVSRGGTNDLSNLQLTCPTCNMKKSDMTDEEFRRRGFEAMYKLTDIDLLAMVAKELA